MIGPSEKWSGMSVVRKVCFKKDKGGTGVKGKPELKGNLDESPMAGMGRDTFRHHRSKVVPSVKGHSSHG